MYNDVIFGSVIFLKPASQKGMHQFVHNAM